MRRIGIVGAGAMGRGIAQVAVSAGYDVTLVDANPDAVVEAVATVRSALARLVAKGRLVGAAAEDAGSRLHAGAGPADLRGVDLVVEAVVEDLPVKRAVFAGLEEHVAPGAVLATNTSSLSVTELASGLQKPERFCGLHFFNPVPLMRLVEVVPGERTEPAVVERLTALVRRIGHEPVVVADTPGFLVNHAGRAYPTEALRLLDEGVAAPADVDRVLRDVAGYPMGPFELLDLTGLDVSQPVMETVWRGFYGDPRLRPSVTGRRRLAGGRLGRKSGAGFYAYEDGRRVDPPEATPPPYDGSPVWVDPGGRALADRLRGAGVLVEGGDRPPGQAVAVVTPWGADVTSTVLRRELPAGRTVGVDPYGDFSSRITLTATPATSPGAATAAWGALAATGAPVTRIADSPGFVAQRVVACVVNLGCAIAELGLAGPADIDRAVTLALGYPRGPLAWGNAIGPHRVLAVLTGLLEATGDPRYRPSPWLVRRARLGLGLQTPATPWESPPTPPWNSARMVGHPGSTSPPYPWRS